MRPDRDRWLFLLLVMVLVLSHRAAAGQPSVLTGLQRFPELLENKHFRGDAWMFAQRAHPSVELPRGARARALRQLRRAQLARAAAIGQMTVAAPESSYFWSSIGPAPIPNSQLGSPQPNAQRAVSGRVESIAVDPGDATHWLIGAAQGGVWETHNGGATWSPKTDDQASLAMGAIAFAPSNPQIIYAGTGETAFTANAYAGGGLLKSTDGGASWQLLAASTFSEITFTNLAVDPANPDVVLAMTAGGITGRGADAPPSLPQRGLFKSVDGGVTWTRKLPAGGGDCTTAANITQCIMGTDLEVDATNFNDLYAALGNPIANAANGVYRSTDQGETWAPIPGPWDTMPAGVGRIELALAPSNHNVLYVSIQDGFNFAGNDGGLLGLWRTTNAWAASPTFTAINTSGTNLPGFAVSYCEAFNEKQCSYDHVLSVDPTNANVVYAGGIPLWKFDGSNWTEVSKLFSDPSHGVHVDQHALTWSGTRLILGNDGGVWSTTDGGATWNDHNTTLATVQFYNGAVHPTNPDVALGGAQDNGTAKWSGTAAWQQVFSGDGAANAFSSTSPDTNWAVSAQDLFIVRTTNGGASFSAADGGINKLNVPFIAALEKCPSNDDIFIAGTDNLWKTTNFFSAPTPSWTANGPEMGLVINFFFEPIGLTALAFAPSDTTCNTYAFAANAGLLRLTTNGGSTWSDIDVGGTVPNRYVTDLAFDPTNANVLYATLSGFDEATPGQPGHVFRTTNALAPLPTWSNVSPPVNIPHNSIAVNPTSPNLVYVGTDIGVWISADGAGTWTHTGPESGMPNVAVFDVQVGATTGRVVAFTLGRGAFALGQSSSAHAYITNSGDNTVSVIDTTGLPPAVVATVPVGNGPSGVAVNPEGTLVYVANKAAGNVSVIDTATNQVGATVTVGAQPTGIAVSPNGTRAYVTNFGDGTVSVIDTASQSVTATVPVGAGPVGIAVNLPSTRVYVANQSADTVSVIDTALNAVTATVTVGDMPTGVAVNPASTRVYVANQSDDTVALIDTSTNTVVATTVPMTTPTGLAVNPAGTRLYVTSGTGSNEFCVEDITSEPPVHLFCQGFPTAPIGLAVNPAGTQLYTANSGDNSVWVLDITTENPGNPLITSIPVGAAPVGFGQFIQSTAGAGLAAGTGTCALQVNSDLSLFGTLAFAPGVFNVFGTAVDLHSSVGTVLSIGHVTGFNGSTGTLSEQFQSGTLNFDANGSFTSLPNAVALVADVSNITGSVLPGGIFFTMSGTLTYDAQTNVYTGPCALDAFLPANTSVGTEVTASSRSTPASCPSAAVPVDVTYARVSASGATLVTATCLASPNVPPNFRTDLGNLHFFFDVSTSATVAAPIRICFTYPDSLSPTVAGSLRLLHKEASTPQNPGGFVDRTTLPVDTVHQKVCGQVSQLSPFVVVREVPEDGGFVPPSRATSTCETAVQRHLAPLAAAIGQCHISAASAAFLFRSFAEETCEAAAIARYDATNARLTGCPACVLSNAASLRTQLQSTLDAMNGGIYCAGSVALGGDDLGFVPSDRPTLSCENAVARHATALARAILTCQQRAVSAALRVASFDEEACEATAKARYDTANSRTRGCAGACAMANAPAVRDQIEAWFDTANEQIYCAGSTPLP